MSVASAFLAIGRRVACILLVFRNRSMIAKLHNAKNLAAAKLWLWKVVFRSCGIGRPTLQRVGGSLARRQSGRFSRGREGKPSTCRKIRFGGSVMSPVSGKPCRSSTRKPIRRTAGFNGQISFSVVSRRCNEWRQGRHRSNRGKSLCRCRKKPLVVKSLGGR